MDINYELYKVFYYVADTLSFSEASKQLFISQSAVSQSIKALEKKLDQVLFIRSTKKVQLTPEGEILLRQIEPAINLIKRGESQIMETASTGGQIRIGASDTICRYFLVPYLERFHKAFPNAHIKVTNATSIKCTELLENGQVDLIVANYPNVYLGSLASFRKIRDFHDVFIANQSFAELQGKKLSLKELQRYPIIMLDRKSTTSEFSLPAASVGSGPGNRAEQQRSSDRSRTDRTWHRFYSGLLCTKEFRPTLCRPDRRTASKASAGCRMERTCSGFPRNTGISGLL